LLDVESISYAVWIATILAYGAVAISIMWRSALRRWPALFCFCAISSVLSFVCLWLSHTGHDAAYFWTYWGERVALSCFQFGIIWEIAASLLAATRRWRARLLQFFLTLVVVALSISAFVTIMSPAPLYMDVMRIATTVDRWLSLSACMVFVVLAFSLDAMGIRWRRETLMVGTGLALQGALFCSFSWYISIRALMQNEMRIPSLVRDLVELATLGTWIFAFSPVPKPDSYQSVSEESLRSIIDSLQPIDTHSLEVKR